MRFFLFLLPFILSFFACAQENSPHSGTDIAGEEKRRGHPHELRLLSRLEVQRLLRTQQQSTGATYLVMKQRSMNVTPDRIAWGYIRSHGPSWLEMLTLRISQWQQQNYRPQPLPRIERFNYSEIASLTEEPENLPSTLKSLRLEHLRISLTMPDLRDLLARGVIRPDDPFGASFHFHWGTEGLPQNSFKGRVQLLIPILLDEEKSQGEKEAIANAGPWTASNANLLWNNAHPGSQRWTPEQTPCRTSSQALTGRVGAFEMYETHTPTPRPLLSARDVAEAAFASRTVSEYAYLLALRRPIQLPRNLELLVPRKLLAEAWEVTERYEGYRIRATLIEAPAKPRG